MPTLREAHRTVVENETNDYKILQQLLATADVFTGRLRTHLDNEKDVGPSGYNNEYKTLLQDTYHNLNKIKATASEIGKFW